MTGSPGDIRDLVQAAREILSHYGRDYAIGALKGLAVRNMMSLSLPPLTPGFYPIVKVHEMALRELEEVFYGHLELAGDDGREDLIRTLAVERIWEGVPER
ncbi:MAG: hypothetical protein JSV00_07225 [bacterium]|nr:MAG: hypothetical protein JSV00_07225 [bacterium]